MYRNDRAPAGQRILMESALASDQASTARAAFAVFRLFIQPGPRARGSLMILLGDALGGHSQGMPASAPVAVDYRLTIYFVCTALALAFTYRRRSLTCPLGDRDFGTKC